MYDTVKGSDWLGMSIMIFFLFFFLFSGDRECEC